MGSFEQLLSDDVEADERPEVENELAEEGAGVDSSPTAASYFTVYRPYSVGALVEVEHPR